MMLKFYRWVPVFCLFIILSGCSGGRPDEAQQPEAGSPVTNSSSESRREAAELPESASPKAKTPTPDRPTSTASAKTSQDRQPATQAPPEEALQTLPELSKKEQDLVSKVTKTIQTDTPVSKENPGLVTVNRVLLAQEAMWLLSGSFSTDFQALEPNLDADTEDYQFKITQGDNTQAVIQAIAKSEALYSFTGAAIAVPTQIPASALCRTKQPSTTPPQAPMMQDGNIMCANDGVLVKG